MTDKRCSKHVFEDRGFSHSCSKPPVVERDGKSYCRIHDPQYLEEKRLKWEAEFAAKMKQDRERWAWEEARNKAVAGLTTEELSQLTPEILRELILGVKVERWPI